MKLNKVKETYLIGGVVILVVSLLSWFFLVSPRMAAAAEISERTVATQEKNAKSADQIVMLTKLKDGLVDERTIAQALARKFPSTADQATLLRQIMTAATAAGIPEKNITALGPAAPILGGSSGSAKLPGGGAPPAADDEGKSADKTATPAKAAENLATMTVAFNAKGSFQQVVDMLKNLEDLPRSFLITQVNLSSAESSVFTIAVQGNMYVHRAIPDPEVATYCAPLRLADEFEAKNPQLTAGPEAGKQLAKLLEPAIGEAVRAENKADVVELLGQLMNLSRAGTTTLTAEQKATLGAALAKAAPVILKDCGINMAT